MPAAGVKSEWVVRDQFGEVWRLRVGARGAVLESEEGAADTRGGIARLVYGAFDPLGARGDGTVATALLQIYARLTGESLAPRLSDPLADRSRVLRDVDRAIAHTLRRAAEAGRLLLERVERPSWTLADEPEKPASRAEGAPVAAVKTTWIELQMVGVDGRPMPGVAYRIQLPDGSRREGRLDAAGLLRIEGIDPGSCEVTFPELDQDAWARA